MIKIKLIFLIFVYLFIFETSNANNNDPLQYFLSDLKTLQGNFVQILINENGEELERTEGILYLKIPDSFSWHYQKPYIQKIISS